MKQEIHEFLEHAVRLLDDRKFDAWLALFADDGYYAVMQRANYEKNDNVLVLGEDLKRLKARLISGVKLDVRSTSHFVSCVQCASADGVTTASANFALWRDGIPSFAGRYHVELRSGGADIRIVRWVVVLDNKVVSETVYLPI